jgi:hypothetical protein
MKKNFYLILLVCVGVSCAKKKEERASGGWKELESFHMIMAEVYHPLKEIWRLQRS